MEVAVVDGASLPPGALISVRVGPTRRQAPLDVLLAQTLKFPASAESFSEPLKIDVLLPVASARLVLQAGVSEYRVGLGANGAASTMGIGLSIRHQEGPADANGAVKSPEFTGGKYHDAALLAREYLEQHGLLRYVQALLHAVIQERPKDPFRFMMDQIGAAQRHSGPPEDAGEAGAVGVAPFSVEAKPRAAVVHPEPPPPQEGARRPSGRGRALLEGARQQGEAAARGQRDACVDQPPAEVTEESSACRAGGRDADEQPADSCDGDGQAPEVPTPQGLAGQGLEPGREAEAKAGATGCPAIGSEADEAGAPEAGSGMDQREAAASEEAATSQPQADGDGETQRLKARVRDMLQDAYDNGQLEGALQEVSKMCPPKMPTLDDAGAKLEAEKVKEGMRKLLGAALESGELQAALTSVMPGPQLREATLDGLEAPPVAERPPAATSVAASPAGARSAECEDGVAPAGAAARPSEADADGAEAGPQEPPHAVPRAVQEAGQPESLKACSPSATGDEAAVSMPLEVQKVKERMRTLLEAAFESGKFEAALKSVVSQLPPAVDTIIQSSDTEPKALRPEPHAPLEPPPPAAAAAGGGAKVERMAVEPVPAMGRPAEEDVRRLAAVLRPVATAAAPSAPPAAQAAPGAASTVPGAVEEPGEEDGDELGFDGAHVQASQAEVRALQDSVATLREDSDALRGEVGRLAVEMEDLKKQTTRLVEHVDRSSSTPRPAEGSA